MHIEFHGNLSIGAELFPGEGQTDGWTDVLKLIIAFRNFVNAPRNRWK